MKDKLSCGIVQDLLPTYVEHLTCEETNEAMQAHLAACENCRREYEIMTAPEPKLSERKREKHEVDYFTRVHKKMEGWTGIAIVCAIVIAIAAAGGIVWGLQTYVIGTPLKMEDLEYSVRNINGYMLMDVYTRDRSMEIKDWKEKEGAHGELYLSGRKVKKSPLTPSRSHGFGLDADTYSRVYILDTMVWADGMPISEESRWLYEYRTPYVGNPSALSNVEDTLDIWETVGACHYELQTAQEPYGWTLRFDGTTPGGSGLDARGAAQMNVQMRRNAVQMLAVVGNLGYVSWTYTDEAGTLHTETVTEEDANRRIAELVEIYNKIYATGWVAKDSVKEYAESPASLELLRRILEVAY